MSIHGAMYFAIPILGGISIFVLILVRIIRWIVDTFGRDQYGEH